MTSFNLSIYDPSCSYCWNRGRKKRYKTSVFCLVGRDVQWFCSNECKNGFMKDSKKKLIKNNKVLLKRLTEMYIDMYKNCEGRDK